VSVRLRAAAVTDVGNIRDNNQDDLLIVDDALFVVADGMGGHVAGEVASKEAVDAMREAFAAPGSTDDLRQAVRLANGAVWKRGSDDPSYRGMGTTVTAVAVVDGDKLAIANVGDSRTYLLRQGELQQLTQDHSFVQEAVRSGQLTRAQAESHPRRSQLTRALGVADDVDVDVDVVEPLSGDRLLLCSDGLWDEVGDELITRVLSTRDEPEEAASELVRWAKEAGGRDNITVIVLDVVDGGETGRAVAAGAALDQAGEPTTATSRADVATVALPAEHDEAGGSGARARTSEEAGPGAATLQGGDATLTSRNGAGAGWTPPADGSLMQATDPGGTPGPSRSRLVTWRVLVFVVVLLGVLAAAALIVTRAGPVWAVTIDGNDVVVKEGDKIVDRPRLKVYELPQDIQDELKRGKGKEVENRAAATDYVDRITIDASIRGTRPPPSGATFDTVPGAGPTYGGRTPTTATTVSTVPSSTPDSTFPPGG
jgi:protein phosphatase